MDNTGGMTFEQVLAAPGVTEEVELRGPFGFLAYHGGPVERVTSLIAREAAKASNATLYAIDQPAERPLHIPSTRVSPDESPALASVFDRVDSVCTVHGYGRDMDKQWILLGGQNRDLAAVMAEELRERLPGKYLVIDELERIPKELRGVHPRNPVNLPANQGVQVELPPGVRWNWNARDWGDAEGLEPTPLISGVIEALAAGAIRWHDADDATET